MKQVQDNYEAIMNKEPENAKTEDIVAYKTLIRDLYQKLMGSHREDWSAQSEETYNELILDCIQYLDKRGI